MFTEDRLPSLFMVFVFAVGVVATMLHWMGDHYLCFLVGCLTAVMATADIAWIIWVHVKKRRAERAEHGPSRQA